jgi:hypothetical protein
VFDPRTSPWEHNVTPAELVQSAAAGLAEIRATANVGTARMVTEKRFTMCTAGPIRMCRPGSINQAPTDRTPLVLDGPQQAIG